MTTLTETLHRDGFIISDAGEFSYEKATVPTGQTLVAGEVVQLLLGEAVTYAGATSDEAWGISVADVDTTDGALVATFLVRNAQVRLADLTYPAGTTTQTVNDLAALNGPIICR